MTENRENFMALGKFLIFDLKFSEY